MTDRFILQVVVHVARAQLENCFDLASYRVYIPKAIALKERSVVFYTT